MIAICLTLFVIRYRIMMRQIIVSKYVLLSDFIKELKDGKILNN